jgi:hypothetical protein
MWMCARGALSVDYVCEEQKLKIFFDSPFAFPRFLSDVESGA